MLYLKRRFALSIVITLFQVYRFAITAPSSFKVRSQRNKALYGYGLRNVSTTTMEECLGRCLADCLCMSFQICAVDGICQLCSSTRYLMPEAMRVSESCTYYDFEDEKQIQEANQQCDSSCMTAVNCCMVSSPCLNGGTCFQSSNAGGKRFDCKCLDAYEGDRCEKKKCPPGYKGAHCDRPIRSCRGYADGSRIPGSYTVIHHTGKPFKVFCDFDLNSSDAWTLIQSYKLYNNDHFKRLSFLEDSPVDEDNPSWMNYRLSKTKMASLQRDSIKWRITCSYDTDGVVYTDYVRALKSEADILSFDNETCVHVEYINVRGENCTSCTAFMSQSSDNLIPRTLHFDVYHQSCDFKPEKAMECLGFGEDSFGYYLCKNDKHRCSSSGNSTTQTWFG